MPSMITSQQAFVRDIARLLEFGWGLGFIFTDGEAWRPVEMQKIYVATKRSKTMDSEHINRRARDFNIFVLKNGGYQLCTRDEIKPLGDYWESLSPLNRWGGNWRGLVDSGKSDFIDAPHFERTG